MFRTAFSNVFHVFYNPFQTFTHVKQYPKVLLPCVLLLITYIVFAISIVTPVSWHAHNQAIANGEKVVPDAEFMRPGVFLALSTVPIFNLILTLFVAVILLNIFKLFGLIEIPDRHRIQIIVSAVLYSSLITILMFMVKAILINYTKNIYASASMAIFAQNAGYRPDDALFVLCQKTDIFYLWHIAVLAYSIKIIYSCSLLTGVAYSILLALLSNILFSYFFY